MLVHIPINQIICKPPRKFKKFNLDFTKKMISRYGIVAPIIVKKISLIMLRKEKVMSRYYNKCGDDIYVAYGWDPPLQTYFVQVFDHKLPEDNKCIVWRGCDPGDTINTIEELQNILTLYLILNTDEKNQLEIDKVTSSKPTPLQNMIRKMFENG